MINQIDNKKNFCTYKYENEVCVREIVIDSQRGGEKVEIVMLADPHFNKCNENDLKNPTLKSTHEKRLWLANGASAENTERCLEYAKDADLTVICGDALDYLSEGCIELLYSTVWDKYPETIVGLGNHEAAQKMQGEVNESLPMSTRLKMLEKAWHHDPFYTSRIIGDKVMAISIDNAVTGHFLDRVTEPLRHDLELAREKSYTVLIFYHIPMATLDPEYKWVRSSFVGDGSGEMADFCDKGVGGAGSTDNDLEVYKLITNNADVIGGCFCGHTHNDFYTEIKAYTASGEPRPIPQYVLIGTPYNNGHVLKITVR